MPQSEPEWTPGPWRVTDCDQSAGTARKTASLISGPPVPLRMSLALELPILAEVWGPPPVPVEERKANARLIAAAPDLYAALLEIADALEGARAANPEASLEFFEELVEIEPGWRKRISAALAKARGEQPDAAE